MFVSCRSDGIPRVAAILAVGVRSHCTSIWSVGWVGTSLVVVARSDCLFSWSGVCIGSCSGRALQILEPLFHIAPLLPIPLDDVCSLFDILLKILSNPVGNFVLLPQENRHTATVENAHQVVFLGVLRYQAEIVAILRIHHPPVPNDCLNSAEELSNDGALPMVDHQLGVQRHALLYGCTQGFFACARIECGSILSMWATIGNESPPECFGHFIRPASPSRKARPLGRHIAQAGCIRHPANLVQDKTFDAHCKALATCFEAQFGRV